MKLHQFLSFHSAIQPHSAFLFHVEHSRYVPEEDEHDNVTSGGVDALGEPWSGSGKACICELCDTSPECAAKYNARLVCSFCRER